MYCQKCGNKLADDDIFCSKCGAKVIVNLSDKERRLALFMQKKLHEMSDFSITDIFGEPLFVVFLIALAIIIGIIVLNFLLKAFPSIVFVLILIILATVLCKKFLK